MPLGCKVTPPSFEENKRFDLSHADAATMDIHSLRTAAPAPRSPLNLTSTPPRGGMRNVPGWVDDGASVPALDTQQWWQRSSRGNSRSHVKVTPVRPGTGTPALTCPSSQRSISKSHCRFTFRSRSRSTAPIAWSRARLVRRLASSGESQSEVASNGSSSTRAYPVSTHRFKLAPSPPRTSTAAHRAFAADALSMSRTWSRSGWFGIESNARSTASV
mmetsp:Transcript_5742/g.25876  ORF Transcript_5742/g.25876 Transcript_5742/m.25876 type:complete len:217 (-) Transcript_5742:5001-5651(-)